MPTDRLAEYSSRQMIQQIKSQLLRGFGFIPLLGSGLSAPSGILMGQDFTEYLAFTMKRVLSENKDPERHRWSIRKDGWPRFPTGKEVDEVRSWLKEAFITVCERNHFEVRYHDGLVHGVHSTMQQGSDTASSELATALRRPPVPQLIRHASLTELDRLSRELTGRITDREELIPFSGPKGFSTTSEEYIFEAGIRSLWDWRATLEFLAKVDVDDRGHLILRQRDPSIIDGFNNHITRDRQCSLGHKMLAHLAGPMRFRVLLTTNFDTLTEEAFKRVHIPLTVIPVSSRGELPKPDAVRSQDTLVKLHGDRIETRADFTLDQHPSNEDLQAFAEYFTGTQSQHQRQIPCHLFVVGFSASDLRIIQMIKHLLDVCPDTHVNWICFSQGDVDRVNNVFFEQDYRLRITVHETTRPDLFMYELYQGIRLCLPGGGFAYEFSHKVPPQRPQLNSPHRRSTLLDRLEKELQKGEGDVVTLARSLCVEDGNPELSARDHCREAVAKYLSNYIVDSLVNDKCPELPEGLSKHAALDRYVVPADRFPAKKRPDPPGKSLENVLVTRMAAGVANSMDKAFQDLRRNHHRDCVWLELQDYSGVAGLAQEMFRVIALRLGLFQLEHVALFPFDGLTQEYKDYQFRMKSDSNASDDDDQATSETTVPIEEQQQPGQMSWLDFRADYLKRVADHLNSLVAYFNIAPGKWVFFLYGRNGPGAASGWENDAWKADQYKDFLVLLEVLDQLSFQVVYAPMTSSRRSAEEAKMEHVEKEGLHGQLARALLGIPDEDEKEWKKSSGLASRLKSLGMERTRQQQKEIRTVVARFEKADDSTDSRSPISDDAVDSTVDPPPDGNRVIPQRTFDRRVSIYDSLLERALRMWLQPTGDYVADGADWVKRRLSFLYGVTLFRQSRHTSAFFSDGVYSCPRRFNTDSDDNDIRRARHVSLWINELCEARIFFHKPGGYCWKYRDIRLGIQKLLQSLPLYRSAEDRDYNFLLESRSRTHYWIGDWYQKAFHSTGHYIPIIESLYHRYQCIRYASFAKPSKLTYTRRGDEEMLGTYQALLVRSSLVEIIKTLQMGRRLLKFWLSGINGHDMFNDRTGCKVFEQGTKEAISRMPKEHRDKLTSLLVDASGEMDSIQRSLKGEGGAFPGKARLVPPSSVSSRPVKYPNLSFDIEKISKRSPQLGSSIADWKKPFDKALRDNGLGEFVQLIEDFIAEFCYCTRVRQLGEVVQSLAQQSDTSSAALNSPEIEPPPETPSIDVVPELKVATKWLNELVAPPTSDKEDDAGTQIHTLPAAVADIAKTLQVALTAVLTNITSNSQPQDATDSQESAPEQTESQHKELLDAAFDHIQVFCEAHREYSRRKLDATLKKWKSTWIMELANSDGSPLKSDNDSQPGQFLLKVVDLLSEYAYLHLQRAKLVYHARPDQQAPNDNTLESHTEDPKAYWVAVAAICFNGLDFCKHLRPAYWGNEIRYKCKFQAIYSIALANLSRFYEAHRHLNEAEAMLSKAANSFDTAELAVLRLRRAEVYLTNAIFTKRDIDRITELQQQRHIDKTGDRNGDSAEPWHEQLESPSTDEQGLTTDTKTLLEAFDGPKATLSDFLQHTKRRQAATLDDAWAALEAAEKLLAGTSHSVLWWGRLFTLKLRVFGAECKDPVATPLSKRQKKDLKATIRELLEKGVRSNPQNAYRRLRLIDYFAKAWDMSVGEDVDYPDSVTKLITKILADPDNGSDLGAKPQDNPNTYVETYRKKLKKRLLDTAG